MGKKIKHAPGAGPVRDGFGPDCFRCGEPMARFVHGPNWKPTPSQAYYFKYWYSCENKRCRTQQVNPVEPEAKVWVNKAPPEVPPWEDDQTPKADEREVEASDLKPFQIRVTDDWLMAVDDWRRKQTRIPSVAEAIRQLVSIGVDAEVKPKRPPTL